VLIVIYLTDYSMRTLFFGTAGRFSALVMEALFAAGVDLVGVVIAAPAGATMPISRLPMLRPVALPLGSSGPPTILQQAGAKGIPAYAAGQLAAPETLAELALLHAELGAVACFPRLLPPEMLALPPFGVLNVHPSLLPALRGPDPLYWALREGMDATGVTVHMMDEHFDTGPIVLQETLPIPPNTSYIELEERAARLGGGLLARSIDMRRSTAFAPKAQPPGGSYRPFPPG
jgi:methionyl-tRNA formyltransferase